MRAIGIEEFGDEPHVVDVDEPGDPGPGHVRVRVAAAGLNPVDLQTARQGFWFGGDDVGFPLVLGWESSGTVDAVGEDVVGLEPGDGVIAFTQQIVGQTPQLAELVVLPSEHVAPRVEVDPVDGATLPLNGLTALQALNLAAVDEGDTLLVVGIAGQVGGFLAELAAGRGVRVIGSCRPDEADLAGDLGAALTVDRDGDLAAQVRELTGGRGADATINAAGAPTVREAALDATRDGGVYVSVVPEEGEVPRGITWERANVTLQPAQLARLSGLVTDGVLTPRVGSTHPAEEIDGAVAAADASGSPGKVVITF